MKINKSSDPLKMYRFHILYSLMRCGVGAFKVIIDKKSCSEDTHLTIITFSIFPQLTRIWYYFFRRILRFLNESGIKTECIIIDCHGNLSPSHFPDAEIKRFINLYHGRKLDYFVLNKIKSKLVWVCDDDTFVTSPDLALKSVQSFYSDQQLAAISFLPRTRWRIHMNGQHVPPMGSYCLLLNRDIVAKEKLKFSANLPNIHYPGYKYDTGDFMHVSLLEMGYKVRILDEHARNKDVPGFKGGSISKILEWACSKDELAEYFRNPFSYGNHLRYHLSSFYISTKVAELYNVLFKDDKYFALFTEKELVAFVDSIRDQDCKTKVTILLEAIDKNHKQILETVRIMCV